MYVYIRVYYTDWILVKKQNQCCTEKLTLQNTLLSLLLLSLLSLSLLLLSLLVLVVLLLCIRTHPGGFLSSMHTLLTLHVPRWAQNESSKPAHLQDFVKVHTRTVQYEATMPTMGLAWMYSAWNPYQLAWASCCFTSVRNVTQPNNSDETSDSDVHRGCI